MGKVSVFVMKDCGACSDYMPRFTRLAGPLRARGLPVEVIDIDSPKGRKLAKKFAIDATPTTVIERSQGGGWKQVGAVPDAAIKNVLGVALRV